MSKNIRRAAKIEFATFLEIVMVKLAASPEFDALSPTHLAYCLIHSMQNVDTVYNTMNRNNINKRYPEYKKTLNDRVYMKKVLNLK